MSPIKEIINTCQKLKRKQMYRATQPLTSSNITQSLIACHVFYRVIVFTFVCFSNSINATGSIINILIVTKYWGVCSYIIAQREGRS